MTFPTTIQATKYSALSVTKAAVPGSLTEANLKAAFLTNGNVVTFANVRDFPAFGTPANIVKVPVYGQAQSQSVGAQADAPDLEVTINYVPTQWIKGASAFATSGVLGDAVGDGISKVFQFNMSAAASPNQCTTMTAGNGLAGSVAAPVENVLIYFVGRVESILVQPARDDAATATVALSIQSDFYGPFTLTATT